jgi:hypothetical protein
MKLARYWTRASGEATRPGGDRVRASARGWSNDSVEAARDCAREIANRAAARIAAGRSERGQYEYGEHPLPEPVLQAFPNSEGTPGAVVTRNAYGALVLNASSLMFVDVDVDPKTQSHAAGRSLGGIFGSLFGKPSKPAPSPPDPFIDGFRKVAERHGLAARVYQTAAGYRLAITNLPFQPSSSETKALLQEFGSDPLYMRLCRQQDSFRARLSPKPWRCQCYQLNVKFPFETPLDKSRYQGWESYYNSKSSAYSTCRYVTSLGTGVIAPEFSELIRCHDRETKSESALPLA